MGTGIIIAIIVIVIIVLLALWFIAMYNGLIKLRNRVQESWHQIDVELKRRHDLIPNLVETVKGYAAHERGTLEGVMQARSAAMAGGAGPAQTAQNENMLTQALGRLFAVAENYPNLKANQNFLALQQELSATEDRIAAGRRYYNANVRQLNTKVQSIPTNIIAGMANIHEAEYFEVEDQAQREAPQVSFGTTAPGAGAAAAAGPGGPGAGPAAGPAAGWQAPTGEPGSPVSPSSTDYGSGPGGGPTA
ncbi:MAG TPA: LemA family protein [Segeticoccus sp.]|uniref:LemA family protein n=1 Tax=Segeticoccus sp. TaxID=2706531 RepID=UPI002D81159B|nr:LemA family protein [Segeticoccus sp.]HET8601054.1 LemA family protein [Segeticoccus sp.]